jgi:hypothetical protein
MRARRSFCWADSSLRGFSVRSLSKRILPNKTRVLILGGGFGGLYAALHLDKTIGGDRDV